MEIKTGTREWSDYSKNIAIGCANDCLYCYAASNADKFGQKKRSDWHNEKLNKSVYKNLGKKDGVIMFPTTHDITPFNIETFILVTKELLFNGNRLLIVSKPRIDCIKFLIESLPNCEDRVEFRFTIGSTNNNILSFWEPGAPSFEERLECLKYAFNAGYTTSISIEPMLEGIEETIKVVNAVNPYTNNDIWIGKMNKLNERVNSLFRKEIDFIKEKQSDTEILKIYNFFKDNPKIKWKDSIKIVLEKGV